MNLFQKMIKPIAMVIIVYTLLYYFYEVTPSYGAEIEQEYSGIDILYTEEFENNIDHTYQVIAGTDINVREGPGRKYEIYKTIPENTPVDIIGNENYNNWVKVWIDLDEYWVYSKNLKVIKRSIYN